MARFTDFNAGAKTTAASTTVLWTGTELPANNVVAYHVYFTGAGMTIGDLTRIRLKSGGTTIYDVDFAHFTAWYERYSFSNRLLAAANVRLTIPLWLPGVRDEDEADVAQMPFGAPVTLELQIGAGGAAGTAIAGYTQTTVAPRYYPVLVGNALNWAVGPVNQQKYYFAEPGAVKGFSINSTGLNRVKLTQGGVQRFQADGTLVVEDQSWSNSLGQTDPVFIDLSGPALRGGAPAPPGNSYLEGDTAAAWVGVANESCIYAIRNQGS